MDKTINSYNGGPRILRSEEKKLASKVGADIVRKQSSFPEEVEVSWSLMNRKDLVSQRAFIQTKYQQKQGS